MSQSFPPKNTRNPATPLVVAITGCSGSGKSFLAKHLASTLHPHAGCLALDDFYRDVSHLPEGALRQINFDLPSAIDWATFLTALTALRSGRAAQTPQYDHSTHSRKPIYRTLEPKPIVIVEGLWLFHSPAYQSLYHRRLYIHCSETTRLQRRISRDAQERSRSEDSVAQQFHSQVVPSERKWVLPQQEEADQIEASPIQQDQIDNLAKELTTQLQTLGFS